MVDKYIERFGVEKYVLDIMYVCGIISGRVLVVELWNKLGIFIVFVCVGDGSVFVVCI